MNNAQATVPATEKASQLSMFLNANVDKIITRDYNGRDWFFLGEQSLKNDPAEWSRFNLIYKGVEDALAAANERSMASGRSSRKVIVASHNGGDIVIGISENALLNGYGRTLKFSIATDNKAGTPTSADKAGVMV